MSITWKKIPYNVLKPRRDLEKNTQASLSMLGGSSTCALASIVQIPACHPSSRSIEDGGSNFFVNWSMQQLVPVSSISRTVEKEGRGHSIDGDGLPPVDGGRKAWLFMLGAFLTEGFMWGFPLTYGVYQEYYQSHPPFKGNEYLPIVGTLCTGLSCLCSPLITPFTIKYPQYQRYMIWGGWLLCLTALVVSSFATQFWHLVVTQGLLYGVGFLFIYYPLLSMLNEWWVERRGFAYGIMFGSAGICGLGFPFLTEKMIDSYGHAVTLRGSALALGLIVGPSLFLLRARNPPAKQPIFQFDISVFRNVPFLSMTLSNSFQGLVFYLPPIIISSYATTVGLSTAQGTLILSLLNLAQVFGQMGMGYLLDHVTSYMPMCISSFVTAIAVFFLWGFFKTMASLVIFGMLYGLFAGGYGVLYCRFVTTLTDDRAMGLWLYSIFEFQRGAGSILGGSLTGLLMNKPPGSGYGVGNYETLILAIGGSFLISSVGGIGWFFRSAPKLKNLAVEK